MNIGSLLRMNEKEINYEINAGIKRIIRKIKLPPCSECGNEIKNWGFFSSYTHNATDAEKCAQKNIEKYMDEMGLKEIIGVAYSRYTEKELIKLDEKGLIINKNNYKLK